MEYIGQLPLHKYVFIDSRFTHRTSKGFIPAVWFGLVSYPGRVWGCTVMLESGAIYRNIPPHAIAFVSEPQEQWEAGDAQTWDCYGWNFTVIEYQYLQTLECKVKCKSGILSGTYLLTASPFKDAFSAYPEQAKEFVFIELENGRLTIQPTNHVVFLEKSFTKNSTLIFPSDLKRQTEIWHCE